MAVKYINRDFPQMARDGYKITSHQSPSYNCVAWALHDDSKRWDPIEVGGYYWPPDQSRARTVENFADLFNRNGGFVVCENADHEEGYEKIAIFGDAIGNFMHVARQVGMGKWTSKLGDWEDVEHGTLEALEGGGYGHVAKLMRRPLI